MTIPDYQTLMLPLLERAAAKDIRVPEIENEIADEFNMTSDERQQMLPSARQKILHNRLHWAKFYLAKAGLVTSLPQHRFAASDLGRKLLSENPKSINNETLKRYPSFREFYYGGDKSSGDEGSVTESQQSSPVDAATATPEEQIEAAQIALHSSLRLDLIQRILQNGSSFFERVIIDLLVAMGYGGSHQNAATQLGKSGDSGVDGVINEDRLGLDRVYVQAKRYKDGSVHRPEVQAFVGSLVGLGANKGVFVTTSAFSQGAIEFVRHLSQRVILIDGARLADLMIEHNVGVRVSRALEFKRIDEDFFSEDE